MTDIDDSQFFLKDGHYCAHCVGNRNEHTETCPVPKQIAESKENEQ